MVAVARTGRRDRRNRSGRGVRDFIAAIAAVALTLVGPAARSTSPGRVEAAAAATPPASDSEEGSHSPPADRNVSPDLVVQSAVSRLLTERASTPRPVFSAPRRNGRLVKRRPGPKPGQPRKRARTAAEAYDAEQGFTPTAGGSRTIDEPSTAVRTSIPEPSVVASSTIPSPPLPLDDDQPLPQPVPLSKSAKLMWHDVAITPSTCSTTTITTRRVTTSTLNAPPKARVSAGRPCKVKRPGRLPRASHPPPAAPATPIVREARVVLEQIDLVTPSPAVSASSASSSQNSRRDAAAGSGR
ncbi:PREDICTED: helicase SRCAP-like [Wasmannia auropunctata]|uniref:helicase SRCAP-like n=1 Tax=Wasmannia auropunctata TaxID=64793 RepID=UPI0005F09768|nr:PREDICTED: helicase SRCAP-like [Wasmannia auropunctata]